MGGSGNFPIELVLFGMIALFLVLRLRSILGRRTGFERPPQPAQPAERAGPTQASPNRAEPAAATNRQLPDIASPAGQALVRMQELDRNFAPGNFLAGAEKAFGMIVTAFAAGDRAALRNLLSEETCTAFESAITAREAARQTQRTEIRAIPFAGVEAAELRGNLAAITVRFVSDQINVTLDPNGHPVVGTDGITEITDIWTFERDLTSPNPAWRLAAARTA